MVLFKQTRRKLLFNKPVLLKNLTNLLYIQVFSPYLTDKTMVLNRRLRKILYSDY
jgi:hypothetical protein